MDEQSLGLSVNQKFAGKAPARSGLRGSQQKVSILFAATCVVLVTCLCQMPAARAGTGNSNDIPALAQLESRLFFKTYPKDDLAARLSRLEKRVFGDELDGSVQERLERLVQSQNAPLNPYAQPTPQAQPAPPAVEQVTPASSVTPPQTASRTATVPPAAELDEQDCAIDRAKVAVRAAKDEEITKLLAEGVELWRNRRAAEATEKFEQVVRLDPNNAQAHFSLGIIQESEGNFVEALASYKKASQARPGNKDYKEALIAAEKKANTKQVSVEKRSEISRMAEEATAAYKRGEYLSALDLYKALDQKAPRQALVKYNIGTIYLVMKQPERALEYYKEAHKLNPTEPRYTQAYEQLQSTVRRDENDRRQQYTQAKLQSRFNTLKPTTAPTNDGAMASFGILGKAHADGVMITTVGLASKALRAGLQHGDIIKAVDGTVVKSTRDLNELLSRKGPGQQVQLVVQRAKSLAQVCL